MIILHNPLDALSRDFVAQHGDGNTVIDWQDETAREAFLAGHPDLSPSAFPSVLVEVPAYSLDAMQTNALGQITGYERINVEAHEELLRMPADWSVVEAFQAILAKCVEDNPPAEA